jgi:diguanylate cyclase (GGDEF)-like protein/PAS domain S-box-containing protein
LLFGFAAEQSGSKGEPGYEETSFERSFSESIGNMKLALEAGASAQARALHAERRMRIITDSIPGMVGYWSAELRCGFANEAYRHWFGRRPDQMIGMSMLELLGPDLFVLNEPHVKGVLRGEPQHFVRRLVKTDGTITFTDARYVPDRDERDRVQGFFVLVTDITALHLAREELEAANLRLAQESITDYLTGLSNRRSFTHACAEASNDGSASGRSPGLILLDLDDFKRINDEFGHDGGDAVLQAVGQVLRDQLRNQGDLAARLGGEEFAVLCVDVADVTALAAVAERIRGKLAKLSVKCEKGVARVTASFGVALGQGVSIDWRHLYRHADRALYRAKAEGKDCVRSSGASATAGEKALRTRHGASCARLQYSYQRSTSL